MINFLFTLIGHFRYLLRFCSYAKCVQLGCITGVDLFALKFYLDVVVSYKPLLAPGNYGHCAIRWRKRHSSSLPGFDAIYWSVTDGLTDAVAYT